MLPTYLKKVVHVRNDLKEKITKSYFQKATEQQHHGRKKAKTFKAFD